MLPISPQRAQEILRAHNVERAKHGVAPLQWDWELAKTAQRWASQCRFRHWKDSEQALGRAAFAATNPPVRNGQWLVGENLAMTAGQPKSARSPVDASGWVAERGDWTCGRAIQSAGECRPGAQCGHLTQMLWDGTTHVGCAIQECPRGLPEVPNSQNAEYLVCEYSPPGNFVGETPFPASQCPLRPVSNVAASIPPLPGVAVPGSATTGAPRTPSSAPSSTPPAPAPPARNRPSVPGAGENGSTADDGDEALPFPTNTPSSDTALVSVVLADGTRVSVAAQQASAVRALSAEQQAQLAQRLSTVPPSAQPSAVDAFLAEPSAPASPPFWVWAGIALGVLAGVLLIVLVVWLIVYAVQQSRRKEKDKQSSQQPQPTRRAF